MKRSFTTSGLLWGAYAKAILCCRLTMYLQSKEVAMSEGPGKNKVRNNAAAIALFKMYETHDVIKVSLICQFYSVYNNTSAYKVSPLLISQSQNLFQTADISK